LGYLETGGDGFHSEWKALVDRGGDGIRLVVPTQQLSSRRLAVLSDADVLRIENEDLCLSVEEIGEYCRMAGAERFLLRQ